MELVDGDGLMCGEGENECEGNSKLQTCGLVVRLLVARVLIVKIQNFEKIRSF